jgi:predicted aspartyl protease
VWQNADRTAAIRTRGCSTALATLVLLLLACQLPAHASAACKLKSVEMPVKIVGTRAIANVRINGTEVPMLVDSGAFFSFLTEAAVAQLGLPLRRMPGDLPVMGLTGRVDARMTTVKRLELLKGEFTNIQFGVGVNEPGSGAMGLLGRNFLAITDIEYDLAHGMIRLMLPEGDCGDTGMAYWAGDAPVIELELRDGRSDTPAIKTHAKLNGRRITVMFDTGATTVVALSSARSAGVTEAQMTPAGRIRGAGHGEVKSWAATIEKFELGGEAIAHSRLAIADFDDSDYDMLLGIDFFLAHRIYVSKQQRRVYLTYNGGPVFALNPMPADDASSAFAAKEPDQDKPATAADFARRGAALAARRDFVHALEDLDRACEMAPDQAEHVLQRGEVHLALKQPRQALLDFNAGLRLDPGQHEARLRRAQLRAGLNDRHGALDDLLVLDQQAASQAHLRRDMAQLYERLNQLHAALRQWDLWLAAHTRDVEADDAFHSRCRIRITLGIELDKALDDCDEAVDRQSKNAGYLESRAWVRLLRGEFRKAVSDCDRALGILPDAVWSLFGRGIARLRLGDIDKGRADIAAARALLPAIDAQAARFGVSAEEATPDRPERPTN